MDARFQRLLAQLQLPSTYGAGVREVQRIDTHGAVVFLAGESAYKLKRPVKLPYMDFSTIEKRRAVLLHELEINRENAPTLYLDVLPVVATEDEGLAIGGPGEPLEWVLHMQRFPDSALLSNYVRAHGLNNALILQLVETIGRSHDRAPISDLGDGRDRIARVVEQLDLAFAAAPDLISADLQRRFSHRCHHALDRAAKSLEMRSTRGYVRRCHGDLHLGNIVMLEGRPVLFDALEFDDEMATIDILYDLAFLIMDLMQRGLRPAAQLLLNRYALRTADPSALYGLAALPLFLAARAGVRALVTIDRSRQVTDNGRAGSQREILTYLNAAIGYLTPPPARLIAIGGLSGTGKTTLAASIAHQIGAAPGALHLRSDVERKVLCGVDEHQRLGPEAYTPEVTAKVYGEILQKSKIALHAGHSVVVDAVFARPEERHAIAQAAERLEIPFVGLWLTAPADKMKRRVETRTGDASDATPEIVEKQLSYGTGPISWTPVDAGGSREETLREVRRVLSRKLGSLA